ncbi:MAG: hypothetical protein WCI73_17850, partial [Phycisphaerae bacterium]
MADKLAESLLTGQATLAQVANASYAAPGLPSELPATPAPEITADAVPEAKAPSVGYTPDTGRKFPCQACGARLDFDPTLRALKCPYCGHVEEINPARSVSAGGGGGNGKKRGEGTVAELDFETYLHQQAAEKIAL